MGYFITPKHSGSIENFIYPLLVLKEYEHDQWVSTEDFKNSLFNLYVRNNIDSEWVLDDAKNKVMKNDSSDYTKDLQLPAYFGFAEADSFLRTSSKRITSMGNLLLEEYEAAGKSLDSNPIKDLFLEAMEKVSFGKNNYGVINSDTEIEAPALYLKSAILLEGLSVKEFAYIVEQMESGSKDFSQVIIDVKRRRKLGLGIESSISTDMKFVTLFKNIGILVNGPERNLNYVCQYYLDNRYDRVSALPIDNKEKYTDSSNEQIETTTNMSKSIQIIYYGAPGTGKSNEIKMMTANGTFGKNFTFRTTLHPDSDYSSFVGSYKPIWNGEKIIYVFRPQSFLKAYVEAWKNPDQNVALVIEEINRGNCAQVFGDIFQLLDRESNGLSKYPIEADIDLQSFLKTELDELDEVYNASKISEIDEYYNSHYANAFRCIKNGTILTLPMNLSILATMNTSDQSLFPMDSAFKRRWEWHYMPIVEGIENGTKMNWKIKLDDNYQNIDWWNFLQRINAVISDLTTSEDKQIGYFFCQPNDYTDKKHTTEDKPNLITAKLFVDKVIFYLWNDIFKDYAFDAKCCKGSDDKEILFAKFYNEDGKTVNIEILKHFFDTLRTDNQESLIKLNPSVQDTNSSLIPEDSIQEMDNETEAPVIPTE